MKRIAGLLLAIGLVCSMSSMPDVQAKGYVSKEEFDYDWYLKKHPDLAAIYSVDDHDAIWDFYETTGNPAGWVGRRTKISYVTKELFDYDTFLTQNPDVQACFGTDYDAIYDWYITTGIKEGRVAKTKSVLNNTIIEMYDIAESITNDSMSDREKVKAVHDWMCIHIAYDWDNYKNGTIPSDSYSVIGPIQYGKGVCSGYAKTFESFMNILGIESEQISGTATNSIGNTGGHAWNKVKVDGKWYWIDVTWDDPVPDKPGVVQRYKYFMISEEQMNRDHYPSTMW